MPVRRQKQAGCLAALLLVAASSAAAQDVATIRTATRRVVVDVVVTGKDGRPLHGLKTTDFTIAEDGAAQTIRSFEEIVPVPSTPSPVLQLPPHTFSNLTDPPSSGPVTVLLYDVLNTPADAMPYAHQSMVRFLRERQGGSQVAIFVLGDTLRMIQGFTASETDLLAAINSKPARTQQSSLLLSTDNPSITTSDQQQGSGGGNHSQANMLSNLKDLEATENTYLLQQRLDRTVNAFAQIARFLAALPGRKNLLWLSGSFPTSVLPNGDPAVQGTGDEFLNAYSYNNRTRQATDLLAQSHVAIYPVDVRGLQVSPVFSAASNKQRSATGFSAQIAAEQSTFAAQQASEHGTMDQVAGATGGRAFYNTNGLAEALATATEEGSNYYTLSYTPSNRDFNGRLRHITIKLDQPALLDHRREYFALASGPDATPPHGKLAPRLDPQIAMLTAAMQHGAPPATQLTLVANLGTVAGPQPATVEELEHLQHYLPAGAKPASRAMLVQHYSIGVALLGRQLEMPANPDGTFASGLIVTAAALAPDGQQRNGTQIQLDHPLTAEQHRLAVASGFHSTLELAVPLDVHTLKLGVMDLLDSKIGTVEIPLPLAR